VTEPHEEASLGSRVAFGIRWGAFDQAAQMLLRVGGTVVLAHLLSPADIGLVALAVIIVGFGVLLVGLGASDALIQLRDLDDQYVRVAFTLSLVTGAAACVVALAICRPLADLFSEPRLAGAIAATSPMLVLTALERTPNDVLVRTMRFRDFYISSTIATAASVVVGVVLAARGLGIWALVAMALTEAVGATALAWFLAIRAGVWRPGCAWEPRRARTLVRFGLYVTGTRMLGYANVDNVFVGKVLGAAAVGFYSLALRLVFRPLATVSGALSATAFSAFSSVQDDIPRLREGIARATRYVALVCFPLSAAISISASLLVPAVLGSRWAPSVPLVEVLALLGPELPFSALTGSLFQAVGRPEVRFRLGMLSLGLTILGVAIGVQHGMLGVAAGVTAAAYAALPVTLFLRARLLETSIADQVRPALTVGLATIVMAGTMLAVREWLEGRTSTGAALGFVLLAGGASFLAALRVFAPGLLRHAVRDLHPRSG
jgi:PST family polysaccharide transporter